MSAGNGGLRFVTTWTALYAGLLAVLAGVVMHRREYLRMFELELRLRPPVQVGRRVCAK